MFRPYETSVLQCVRIKVLLELSHSRVENPLLYSCVHAALQPSDLQTQTVSQPTSTVHQCQGSSHTPAKPHVLSSQADNIHYIILCEVISYSTPLPYCIYSVIVIRQISYSMTPCCATHIKYKWKLDMDSCNMHNRMQCCSGGY